MRRTDARPLVLGCSAWAGAWLATSGEQTWWLGGALAAAVVGLVGLRVRRRLLVACAVLALGALLGGVVRVVGLASGEVAYLAREGAVVEIEAVLQGGPRVFLASGTRPQSWMSRAVVTRLSGRDGEWLAGTPVELSATGDDVQQWRRLAPGTTVRVAVRLGQAGPEDGLAALARARGRPVLLAPPGGVDAAVEAVRSGLRRASDGLDPDARALVPALVVGDTSLMSPDLTARFKTTGLTHLTAVSGANLVLLMVFVRAAVVRLGVRGRLLTGVLAGTVLGFVTLCLAEPSVVRAAAMGMVGLAALGTSTRSRQGLRYLAVAVLALTLWDPWISRSLGFALSVTASAGLLWWAGPWTEAMAKWAPRWLAEATAVPLAAQLATQPIITAISGQVSVVGVLANALAGPLVGPATVLGFLAAGVSTLWLPLASVLAWAAGWCALGLCWIARLGATLPGATTPWPATGWAVLLVTGLCLAAGILAPRALAQRWIAAACALALVVALLRTPSPPGWPPPAWSIVSCDVGQGDATVIAAGPGEAIVVDAGPDPALLSRCLAQLGVARVPLVVLTHLHADHVSGLPTLVGRGVHQVVTSGVRTPASGEALVQQLVGEGVRHVTAQAGDRWTVGRASVQVLAAEPVGSDLQPAEGESSVENDASLLILVAVDGITVLLAGDTEDTGQERLMRLAGSVDVDVLLVPHHGSSRQYPDFLAATTPQVALISVGAKNDYGHPTAKTLKLVNSLTGNVIRTDQHGSIAVGIDQGRLVLTTQR